MNMYIISYFGTGDVRSKRVEHHKKQIDWAKQQGLTPVVCAQEYQEHEYLPDVEYPVKLKTRVLPAEARNMLLGLFYNSNEDFAVFADNDSVLYDKEHHVFSKDFNQKFQQLSVEQLRHVDMFFPLNPGKVPFTADVEKNKMLYETNWVFQRHTDSKGSFLVVKNIKKHYGKEIYFDEDYRNSDGSMMSHEDIDFACQFLSEGLKTYQCKNLILKEFSVQHSTWARNDARGDMQHAGKKRLQEKFQLPVNSQGVAQYKRLYTHVPQTLYIPVSGNVGLLDI
jgi:hypothetical protein